MQKNQLGYCAYGNFFVILQPEKDTRYEVYMSIYIIIYIEMLAHFLWRIHKGKSGKINAYFLYNSKELVGG